MYPIKSVKNTSDNVLITLFVSGTTYTEVVEVQRFRREDDFTTVAITWRTRIPPWRNDGLSADYRRGLAGSSTRGSYQSFLCIFLIDQLSERLRKLV